jgi:DNA-binding GntR family transcriptional regulator
MARPSPDPLRALWRLRAPSTTLAEGVYQTLRAASRNGVLSEAEPLRENRLAARLAVSRTPVREALQRLTREGLIGHAHGKGVAVPALDARDLDEIYEIRLALEPAAARLAARNVSAHELDAMRAVLAQADAARDGDPGRIAALSARFGDLVGEAARNRRLTALIRQQRDGIVRAEGTTLNQPGRAEKALAEHRALLSALEAGDADAAGRAAQEHLEEARRLRLQLHFERAQP